VTIPTTLWRIWLGDPMPGLFARFGDEWKRLHPSWDVVDLRDSQDVPPLRNQALFDEAPELLPNDWKRLQSDILRLELLEQHGGVYVDTDFEPIKPLDPLLEGVEAAAAWESQGRWVGQAFLASAPGHPFFTALVDALDAHARAHVGQATALMSGPRFVTKVYERQPWGVTIFDKAMFYPYLFSEIDTYGDIDAIEARRLWPNAYAVHHWSNRRRGRDSRGRPMK
jgi:inositol phosphorylceramide mannosyltransferase catalytic subunit